MKLGDQASRGTETEASAREALDKSSEGIEAAVRCYVAGDWPGMHHHLDWVEAGVDMLRGWARELEPQ